MRLPYADRAEIDPVKLRDYLLSTEHPLGRFKARFFGALGFSAERWEALESRKGTGDYRPPSLKGVCYRGPFEHNGSVATLEDWFDARRLNEDYIPTGFKGFGVTERAVKGHAFGLNLMPDEKAALIAFLKTL